MVGAAALLAAADNLLLPDPLDWRGDWAHHVEARAAASGIDIVRTARVRELAESGEAFLLDARPLGDFDAGHIPGAWSVPLDARGGVRADIRPLLTAETRVIAYCSGLSCDDALLLALELHNTGVTNVQLYPGGWEAWTQAGDGP